MNKENHWQGQPTGTEVTGASNWQENLNDNFDKLLQAECGLV